MYLTAQRVLSRHGGVSGVNAFWYAHQEAPRPTPASEGLPDEKPGYLLRYVTVVPPVGNRVLSFLDIVCPEDDLPDDIEQEFRAFVQRCQHSRLPWTAQTEKCLFRFNLDSNIAEIWPDEVEDLFVIAVSLRREGLKFPEVDG